VNETKLPLTDHLRELRSRLIKSLLAWGVGTLLTWWLREEIFGALLRPATAALENGRGALQALAPTEIFFTYMKCALLGGLVLASPVCFWQAWHFIAPGLYPREKRTALPFVATSTLLFAGGGSFGYFVVFPLVFQFLAQFESQFVTAAWSMREVFTFTTQLFLAFGIAFELPILVFFLALAGVVDARQLWRRTPYAILIIFTVAAILTPPDWVSQVLLGIPMVLLYLLGTAAAWFFAPGSERRALRADTRNDDDG